VSSGNKVCLAGRGSKIECVRKLVLVGALAAVFSFVPRPAAADSTAAEPDWEAKIYAFGAFPALYSHPEIGPFTANINITTDELLKHFRWGGGGGLEDRYKDLLLLADGLAAQFAVGEGAPVRNFPVNPGGPFGGGTVTTGPSDAGLRSTVMMLEGYLGWRALSMPVSSGAADDLRRFHLDLLAGARLWYFRNKLTITLPPARLTVAGRTFTPGAGPGLVPREVLLGHIGIPGFIALSGINTAVETTTSWVDPVIGFRATYDVLRNVSLFFKGSVGGFAIGNASNFTWQAVPGVEWRFTENWFVTVSYQGTSFKKGRADDTILYGANLGVGYHF